MEYSAIAVVVLALVIAAFFEHITGNIPPWIWSAGGVIGIVLNVLNIGFCSWIESVITFVIMFVLIFCTYSMLSSAVGGGILKLLWMCSIFWGRYIVIVFVVIFLVTLFCMFIKEVFAKDYDSKIHFVPVLLIANIISFVLYTYIK